jgi:hypothetical protein
MTGIVVLLYIAVGVGCGLIKLSAIAVGIIAIVPAVVGAYAVGDQDVLAILAAIVVPLVVIEAAYFLTMLLMGRSWTRTPTGEKAETGDPARGDLRLQRKPHMREKP